MALSDQGGERTVPASWRAARPADACRLDGGWMEIITRFEGRVDAAAPGQLQFGADRGRWIPASADLATGTLAGKGTAPRYRFVAALSGTDPAEFSTWGYDDDGAFNGVATFRMWRIAPADLKAQRGRLRARHSRSA